MPHQVASQARRDLDEIWHYLAVEAGNESTADKTVDLIVDRFQLLSKWPRLGAPETICGAVCAVLLLATTSYFIASLVPA